MKLKKLLLNIQNTEIKNNLINSKKGKEFEERILSFLVEDGEYITIPTPEFKSLKNFKEIKYKIENEGNANPIFISDLEKISKQARIVYQPLGKQKSPDILLIRDGFVLPLEIKFTSKGATTPTWNSGLPRQNFIYLFGSSKLSNIVFFSGSDLLSFTEEINTKKLVSKTRTKLEVDGKQVIKNFSIYLRPMYNQIGNSWKNNELQKRERNVIDILSNNKKF